MLSNSQCFLAILATDWQPADDTTAPGLPTAWASRDVAILQVPCNEGQSSKSSCVRREKAFALKPY